jgi:hypothetical protein
MSTLNRREFSLAAGAVAAAFAAQAVAQPDPRKGLPGDPDKLHRDALDRARSFTKGAAATSEAGMYALVDQLLAMKLISKEDAASLKQMIKDFNKDESFDAIVTAINNALARKHGEVATTIVRIAKSSLDWAKEKLTNLNPKKLRFVIAHDTVGALEGAAAGATLGALIAGLGAVPGAVMGAIAGSSATSLIAADGYEEKK